MIRGLRDGTDLDYEMQLPDERDHGARGTYRFRADLPAIAITATGRQIAEMGGDVSAFVPPVVAASLKAKFGR